LPLLCRRTATALVFAGCLLAAVGAADAAVLRYCDRQAPPSAAQQDKLLRFASIIKTELDNSGQSVALIARSGLDLSRFGMRYSHAGLSLKASPNAPWSVRQLYYECEENRPKIFDQGVSGFLFGSSDLTIGYISLVFLPTEEAAVLERAALDNRQALQLLGTSYSANAYPYAVLYQNCNQWVMELLATAWGRLSADSSLESSTLRARAQEWLGEQSYVPALFNVGNPLLMWLGTLIPWLHSNDHPREDTREAIYRVSMPASIETFVQQRIYGASRIELCHTERHVVIRRGWQMIAEGCEPGAQDTVIPLE
jgi:hypothetical protein